MLSKYRHHNRELESLNRAVMVKMSSVESNLELLLICELTLIESVIFYLRKNLPTVEMVQFYSEDSPIHLNCYEEEDHVHNKSFSFTKNSFYKITDD